VKGRVHIFDSPGALYAALEERWQQLACAAIADHGAFYVALAGGGTPRVLYERLADQPAIDQFCWQKTHVFFGDERCVPQDHLDSNYRMAKDALLSKVQLLPEHVHPMFSADISVEENVTRYAALLSDTLPLNAHQQPVFDLVLLGMGEDGHTASLFPDTEILHETTKPVAAQFVSNLDAWRMSLTFPVINSARHVAVLVPGESKAKMLAEVLSVEKSAVMQFPIQRVNPEGQLDWYLDTAAAQLLKQQGRQ
jgi:6-phosphogluconolactonase